MSSRRRDQRGLLLSSPVALLSAGAVALAAVAFVATGGDRSAPEAPRAASATPATTPAGPPRTARTPVLTHRTRAPRPVVRRADTYVEVFNNSGISGLAGRTAARAQGAGWQVVGSDNWYGTIPASTVYYPARLRPAAVLLGKDLGIARLKEAIAPMRGDRLTVVLTSDYS